MCYMNNVGFGSVAPAISSLLKSSTSLIPYEYALSISLEKRLEKLNRNMRAL